MSIPWFYMWSEPVFHKVMLHSVTGFDLKSIQSEASTLKERAELIVTSLKSTSEPYIIFSVSDIIVNPGFASELSEVKGDMVFIEGAKGAIQTNLIYLKNSPDVLEFWSSLTDTTLEENLSKFKGTWSKFTNKCQTTETWDKVSEFKILVLVSSGFGKEFDFAEKVFRMAQHIEMQPYMQYIPEDIVPFIYKIQELLFLTHKEMKTHHN